MAAAVAGIDFPNVAAAKKALEARDGIDAVVTHPDGWVIVSDPGVSAQWRSRPKAMRPTRALVKRVIQRDGSGNVSVQITLLCEAPQAACDQLRADFEAMNDRVIQAVKSRGRNAARAATAMSAG